MKNVENRVNIINRLVLCLAILLISIIRLSAQVTYGAENEEIPKLGDTIRTYFGDKKGIKTLKFRDTKTLTIIEFLENKEKKSMAVFPLDNLMNKRLTRFYPNGNIRVIADYVRGFVSGSFELFHTNGNLAEKGTYIRMRKQGKWEYYDDSGKSIKTESYKDGKLIE